MTDNEIIKALECCTVGTFACGKECPYYSSKSNLKVSSCRFELMCEISNLINRQNAEIDRLKDLITYQKQEIKEKEKKYNQAVDDMFGLIETTRNEIAEAKTEAIKEFIDELKNRVVNKYEYTDIRVFKEIDNLVKEMTEVSE